MCSSFYNDVISYNIYAGSELKSMKWHVSWVLGTEDTKSDGANE